MARPRNWRALVAERGWGTAYARIDRHTEKNGACTLWMRPFKGPVPQIRVSVAGRVWTENVCRLLWMRRHGTVIPAGMTVARTCLDKRCVSHLVLSRNGHPASAARVLALRDRLPSPSYWPTPSHDERKRMLAMASAGFTILEIAAHMGRSDATCARVVGRVREYHPERNVKIRELYEKGATVPQLSRTYGLSISRIMQICRTWVRDSG